MYTKLLKQTQIFTGATQAIHAESSAITRKKKRFENITNIENKSYAHIVTIFMCLKYLTAIWKVLRVMCVFENWDTDRIVEISCNQ